MERAVAFRGRYHVLGGLLSALDGVGPEALRIGPLVTRASDGSVSEVILALPATVDGQTTAHYLAERLSNADVSVTMLARGVPVGGELDWLDDGTINQAMRARRPAFDQLDEGGAADIEVLDRPGVRVSQSADLVGRQLRGLLFSHVAISILASVVCVATYAHSIRAPLRRSCGHPRRRSLGSFRRT
jgi:hypothetical protein